MHYSYTLRIVRATIMTMVSRTSTFSLFEWWGAAMTKRFNLVTCPVLFVVVEEDNDYKNKEGQWKGNKLKMFRLPNTIG